MRSTCGTSTRSDAYTRAGLSSHSEKVQNPRKGTQEDNILGVPLVWFRCDAAQSGRRAGIAQSDGGDGRSNQLNCQRTNWNAACRQYSTIVYGCIVPIWPVETPHLGRTHDLADYESVSYVPTLRPMRPTQVGSAASRTKAVSKTVVFRDVRRYV